MNDLIEFLTKCNDEDAAAAAAASLAAYSSWQVESGYVPVADNDGWTYCLTGFEEANGVVLDSIMLGAVACEEPAEHIALHNPARVLRECAARRLILDTARGWSPYALWDITRLDYGTMRQSLYCMAQSYVDRPGFKDEWRVS